MFAGSDTATQIVETIWPLSSVATRCDAAGTGKGVLPLRTFIQETLRRSRTSYSTLQVALYYLIKVKAHVPSCNFTKEQTQQSSAFRAMQCGRRMFLAALILASKYLQDRNYSARAWSKISGLNTTEINQNEIAFLKAVSWELHIPETLFQRWTEIVLKYTPTAQSGASKALGCMLNSWKDIVPRLNDRLELETPIVPDRSESVSPPSVYQNYPPSPPWSDTSDDATPTLSEPSLPTPRAHVSGRTLPSLSSCLPRINIIATPPMSIPNTPAVSYGQTRPAISSAMSQVHQASTHRTTLDPRPTQDRGLSYGSFPTSARRSSLARSISSSSSFSSPESMVSDTSSLSSRSSRSSSISSIASSSCGPSQPSLAVLATRRCANMTSGGLKGYGRSHVTSEPITEVTMYSSPESFDGITRLTDSPMDIVDPAKEAAQALISLPLARIAEDHASFQGPTYPSYINRKRSRCNSVENWSLQQSVSDLLKEDLPVDVVAEDSHMATSFLLQPKEVQIPSSSFVNGSVKLPVPLSMPRNSGSLKRACCETGRARTTRPGIPNGWDNLLLSPVSTVS